MLSPPARSASDSKTWSRCRFVIVPRLSRESRRHPRELPCLRLCSQSCCLTFSTADPRTAIRGDRTYRSRRSLRGVALVWSWIGWYRNCSCYNATRLFRLWPLLHESVCYRKRHPPIRAVPEPPISIQLCNSAVHTRLPSESRN